MQTRFLKISIFIFVIFSLSLLNSCAFIQDSGDDEIQDLRKQVNQMATQNALLLEDISASESEEVNAPSPPEDDHQALVQISTSTPESLPVSPMPAGIPIVYDRWAMTVSKELTLLSQGTEWGSEIFIRNQGETKRTFRFMNAGVTAKDDIGNKYSYIVNQDLG